jgi:uncharacterized membrane protein
MHASLLAGAVGLLFLQRYIWLLKIAQQGYGPYQTVSYLTTLSAVMILIDLVVLRWALRGPQTNRVISLLWPALFFGSALWVVLANNV